MEGANPSAQRQRQTIKRNEDGRGGLCEKLSDLLINNVGYLRDSQGVCVAYDPGAGILLIYADRLHSSASGVFLPSRPMLISQPPHDLHTVYYSGISTRPSMPPLTEPRRHRSLCYSGLSERLAIRTHVSASRAEIIAADLIFWGPSG